MGSGMGGMGGGGGGMMPPGGGPMGARGGMPPGMPGAGGMPGMPPGAIPSPPSEPSGGGRPGRAGRALRGAVASPKPTGGETIDEVGIDAAAAKAPRRDFAEKSEAIDEVRSHDTFIHFLALRLTDEKDATIGALVAVLAAYKDLAAPWKELLDYYQQKEDIRIKYEQVIEQFQPPDLLDPALLTAPPPDHRTWRGSLVLNRVTVTEDGAAKVLEGVSAAIPLDRHTAVINAGGNGADELLLLLRRVKPRRFCRGVKEALPLFHG